MVKKRGNFIYFALPFIFGGILSFIVFKLDVDYEVKGFQDVLASMINFSSIIIGFYSAFYGIILSLKNTNFMNVIKKEKFESIFKYQLLSSLTSAFSVLLFSILFQILSNYDNSWILFYFHFWLFLSAIFVVFSFQTIVLSMSIIFNNESESVEFIE